MNCKFILVTFIILCSLNYSESINEEKTLSRQKRKLLFPQFTTLQLSMCLIAQVSSITSHRLAVNTGFQINYNLPYTLASFYSPVFWARSMTNSSNLLVNFFEKMTESEDFVGGEHESNEETTTMLDKKTTTEKLLERSKRMIKSDISAGQFYSGISDTLGFAGYTEECLLKSVCELAKIPLHKNDDDEDVISELLHFILTPSLHQSFDPEHEIDEQELYEEAERIGKEGGDCEIFECNVSPLHSISNFILPEFD